MNPGELPFLCRINPPLVFGKKAVGREEIRPVFGERRCILALAGDPLGFASRGAITAPSEAATMSAQGLSFAQEGV